MILNSMKIYSQLAKFQQEVGTITKDSKGHNYKYASLDHIIEIITPFLKSNGLGFLHKFDGADIICVLFNTEGNAIDSRFTMPQEEMRGMNMNQSMGASITYARRYTLTAILGLATDEDTDGVVSRPQNNKVAPQRQNTVNNVQSNQDDKPWLNLYTRDGKKIPESFELVSRVVANGAETAKQVATELSKTYKLSKAVYAEIDKIVNEPVVQVEDNINLEEIPFD